MKNGLNEKYNINVNWWDLWHNGIKDGISLNEHDIGTNDVMACHRHTQIDKIDFQTGQLNSNNSNNELL